MEKKDCTQCENLSNYGCSRGQLIFSPCEYFVDWQEAKIALRASGDAPTRRGEQAQPGARKGKV